MAYASDAEKLFWELGDIQSKRNISHSARHKVGGSKSKRAASLLSDHYTKKELEAMNGPVESYKMKNITHQELRSYPREMQVEFIQNLVRRFNINQTQLAKLLGTSQRNFNIFVKKHDFADLFESTTRMKSRDVKALMEYWNDTKEELVSHPEQDVPVVECGVVEEVEPSTDAECKPGAETENHENEAHKTPAKMTMDYLHMTFSGAIDIKSIANSLQWIVGDGNECEITIEVRPAKES